MTDTRTDSPRLGPDDPRYLAVVNKQFNKRFVAKPDYVRLISSTGQVIAAVEEAVRDPLNVFRHALSIRVEG